jgi:multisubunit Na+/H+ antiporter MnhF subunit
MTLWLWTVIVVVAALPVSTVMACRGRMAERLVAVQMVAGLTVMALVIMSFAFDSPMLMDLPLALILLAVPGTLVIAAALDRWI